MSSKRRRSRDDSERAERERLAKARRERERHARANLAAKARGEEGSEGEAEGDEGSEDAPQGKSAAPKPDAGEKPKPDAGEKSKSAAGGKSKSAAKSKRKRGAARKRSKDGRAGGILTAAGRIAGDARRWIVATVPRLGAIALRLVLAFFALFFTAVGAVVSLVLAVLRFARGPLRAALLRLDALSRAASRAVTPARALAAVAAGALILLALSQFADYRSISIGNDSYAPGIQTVAPAPVTETDATGSAHGYVMVPLAAIGLLVLAAAATGRRRLCGVLAAIGLVAVLVALVHDRPAGLDTGDRPLAYEGVRATLVGGFYAQIASGLLLTVSSLLLARELRPEGAGSSARSGRRLPGLRRARLRRRARVQGARA